jgi:hypothetical protein
MTYTVPLERVANGHYRARVVHRLPGHHQHPILIEIKKIEWDLKGHIVSWIVEGPEARTFRTLGQARAYVDKLFKPAPEETGFERRSRLIAESMDITEARHGRVR